MFPLDDVIMVNVNFPVWNFEISIVVAGILCDIWGLPGIEITQQIGDFVVIIVLAKPN